MAATSDRSRLGEAPGKSVARRGQCSGVTEGAVIISRNGGRLRVKHLRKRLPQKWHRRVGKVEIELKVEDEVEVMGSATQADAQIPGADPDRIAGEAENRAVGKI